MAMLRLPGHPSAGHAAWVFFCLHLVASPCLILAGLARPRTGERFWLSTTLARVLFGLGVILELIFVIATFVYTHRCEECVAKNDTWCGMHQNMTNANGTTVLDPLCTVPSELWQHLWFGLLYFVLVLVIGLTSWGCTNPRASPGEKF
jgi:hypothetical protein